MKRIIFIALLIVASFVKAQTFTRVPVNYVKVDYITINGGTGFTFSNPDFYYYDKVDPTSSQKAPGLSFLLNIYSAHHDINDFISSGIELNIQYFKNQWDVMTPGSAVSDTKYNYHFMGKYSEVGFSFGESFTFKPSDNFEIVASAGLGLGGLFYGDNRAEAIRTTTGQIYPDPDLNEWHEPNADENFSIEFSLYGKLGGYYRLTDFFSIGVLGMYNFPLVSSAFIESGKYANAQKLGYAITGYVGKLQFGTLMLSLRFDID